VTRKLGLLLFAILMSGLVAEGALRLLGFHGSTVAGLDALVPFDDPIVDFRLRPSSSWNARGLSYRTNRSGFRDSEYSAVKPEGTTRIVVVGDSVTNGHGVNQGESYAKCLERLLRDVDGTQRYEVPVLALGALNTVQEARLLRTDGLALAPDVVVVGYVLNDPAPNTVMERKRTRVRSRPWIQVQKERAARSSLLLYSYRLAQQIQWRIAVWTGREQIESPVLDDYFADLHRDPAAWRRVVRGFEEIRGLTEPAGTPVVVVIFPVLFELQDYRWSAVHEQVRAEAERNGFRVLDLKAAFESYPAHRLQVQNGDHVHPNAFGHRLAGETLYRFLVESSLLNPAPPRRDAPTHEQS
jgi:hypothetical protein